MIVNISRTFISSNYAYSPFNASSDSLNLRLLLVPLFGGALVLCTVMANFLLIISVRFVRRMREPGNYLFVSLALADMLVGLTVMPVACIYEVQRTWTLGKTMCDLWTYSDVMLCTSSILHLCTISLDRSWTIRSPLTYAPRRTAGRMLLYVAVTWFCAFLVSLPSLCGFSAILFEGQCNVNPNIFFQIYATMVAFYIPAVIMIIVNCQIYAAVKKLATRDRRMSRGIEALANASAHLNCQLLQNGKAPRTGNRKSLMALPKTSKSPLLVHLKSRTFATGISSRPSKQAVQERRAAKNLMVIMSAFIVCWLPFFATILMLTLCVGYCNFVPHWWNSLVLWLGYTNSALNPILVIVYNRDFKLLFLRVLTRYCCPSMIKRAGLTLTMETTMDGGGQYYYSEPVINRTNSNRKHSSWV